MIQKNTIINGNCIKELEKFNDDEVDLTITSPPYNLKHLVRYDKKNNKYYHQLPYTNYKDDNENYYDLLDKTIGQLIRITKYYVFFNIQMLLGNKIDIINILHKYQKNLKDVIIWKKVQCQPSINKTQLSSQFEFIFVFSKEKNCEAKPFERAFFNNRMKGQLNTNVITGDSAAFTKDRELKNFAVFPEYLVEWILDKFSQEGDTILDCFSGSGTTAVVSKRKNRNYIGIELDKEYVEYSEKKLKEVAKKDEWW